MVRLKVSDTVQCFNASQFQFLYGPIKSLLQDYSRLPLQPFQFLYGPIKRQTEKPEAQMRAHFNSSMVRLKEGF